MFLPHPRVKVNIVGSLRDRKVACSALDRQGSNFESCVWRTVLSQSSHHPQEVLLAQFSLYVHKGGLKPDSFHFTATQNLKDFRNSSLWTWQNTIDILRSKNKHDDFLIILELIVSLQLNKLKLKKPILIGISARLKISKSRHAKWRKSVVEIT